MLNSHKQHIAWPQLRPYGAIQTCLLLSVLLYYSTHQRYITTQTGEQQHLCVQPSNAAGTHNCIQIPTMLSINSYFQMSTKVFV